MKRTLTLILSLISLIAGAQEPQIIGGYILDGNYSFEELEAAVLTEGRTKDRKLKGKGIRMPGFVWFIPTDINEEIGSIIEPKDTFLIKSISFTVDENRIDGCRADIRIYRIMEDESLKNIVTIPIHQDIPETAGKTTFNIVPQESIVLDPGSYFFSFSISEVSPEIMEKWKSCKSWSKEEHLANSREDGMYFPLHLQSSYKRESPDSPLSKCKYNIGMSVTGRKM